MDMDPPDPFAAASTGGSPSPTRRSAELQGPRPAPLKVNKDSHKIKKPPLAPPQPHHHQYHHHSYPPPLAPTHPSAATSHTHNPQPIIIYSVSPKVIHTSVSDFKDLVQRLTGSTTSTDTASAATSSGDVSPAARLASVENANSPSERERERASSSTAANSTIDDSNYNSIDNEILRILEGTDFLQMVSPQNNIPSILSPGPAILPPVSPPGIFSPAAAAADPFLMQASNMFIPSPSSTFFSAPMVSPSPTSSYDLYNSFFDF